MTNVLIVDDERLTQELFTKYIESANDRYNLAETTIDAETAELICERADIDLILMDVCTANNSSGLKATEQIKKRFPKIKVIIVTSAPEFRFIEKARKAKADSFWYKDVSESKLIEVMDRTMNGEKIYPDKTPEVEIGYTTSYDFTPKELEVLLHLSAGLSTPSIAEKMGVAPETVKSHLKHLQEKTGCNGKTQLAIFAARTKLVLPEY